MSIIDCMKMGSLLMNALIWRYIIKYILHSVHNCLVNFFCPKILNQYILFLPLGGVLELRPFDWCKSRWGAKVCRWWGHWEWGGDISSSLWLHHLQLCRQPLWIPWRWGLQSQERALKYPLHYYLKPICFNMHYDITYYIFIFFIFFKLFQS